MVERVLRTTRDANTTLDRTHKGGFPILQVPFRKASSSLLSLLRKWQVVSRESRSEGISDLDPCHGLLPCRSGEEL